TGPGADSRRRARWRAASRGCGYARRRRHNPRHHAGRAAGARAGQTDRRAHRGKDRFVTQVANKRVVLGYAGTAARDRAARELVGLGTVVVTVTVDVGQAADVGHVREQALSNGAARAHVFDLREEFARDVVIPALRSGALESIAGRVSPSSFVGRKLSEVAV